jgi:hypothetical protein
MRFVEPRNHLPRRNRTGFHSMGGNVRLTQWASVSYRKR